MTIDGRGGRRIHFDATGRWWHVAIYHAACGPFVYAVRSTTDPEKVTCKNCKRTVSYRAKKAET